MKYAVLIASLLFVPTAQAQVVVMLPPAMPGGAADVADAPEVTRGAAEKTPFWPPVTED